jgi:tetratricopeptide (TPR) repeat protein
VEYFQKAIEIERKVWRLSRGFAELNLTLGTHTEEMKDYEKAEKYLSEGLEGVRKVGDKYWEAVRISNILAGYTEIRETKRLPKIT